MNCVSTRSLERITKSDLKRLGELALADCDEMFTRNPRWARYKTRIFCVALCQGAANHYIDGRTGVKDFDVWTFFRELPDRCTDPCLHRRNKPLDYGPSKFGRHPALRGYHGRKVDLLSRSLPVKKAADPVEAIRQWLFTARPGSSAHYLSQKAVVLIDPQPGLVVWPVS